MNRVVRFFLVVCVALAAVVGLQAQLGLSPTSFSPGQTIKSATFTQLMTNISNLACNRTGCTMVGGVLFSPDNALDLGASGTSRPRDLFLGRNATIGGTLGVTGATTLAALGATTGTFTGAVTAPSFSGSGASLTSIPETAITDGTLLARLAGNETVTGAWTFDPNSVTVRNTTTTAFSGVELRGDGVLAAGFRLYNSAFVTNADAVATGTQLYNQQAGGISISAQHASGPIRFYTGGTTERMRLRADGLLHLISGQFRRPDDAGNAFQLGNGTNSTFGTLEFRNSGGGVVAGTANGDTSTLTWNGAVALAGTISPPAISVTFNHDYNPSGFSTAFLVRLTTTGAPSNITGMLAQPAGTLKMLCHVSGGGGAAILAEDTGSLVANRFANALSLGSNECVFTIYDGTSSRWRVMLPAT